MGAECFFHSEGKEQELILYKEYKWGRSYYLWSISLLLSPFVYLSLFVHLSVCLCCLVWRKAPQFPDQRLPVGCCLLVVVVVVEVVEAKTQTFREHTVLVKQPVKFLDLRAGVSNHQAAGHKISKLTTCLELMV